MITTRARLAVEPTTMAAAGCCLLASLVLFLSASTLKANQYEEMLLLGIGTAVAGAFLFVVAHSPLVGLSTLLISGMLLPPALDRMAGTRLSWTFLLAPMLIVVWLLAMVRNGHALPKPAASITRPLYALCAIAAVSFIGGQFPWFTAAPAPLTAQAAGLGIVLFSAALLLATSYQFSTIQWLRRFVWIFLGIAAFRVGVTVFPISVILPVPSGVLTEILPSGPLGSMFWTWLMAIGVSQGLVNKSLSLVAKVALAALCGAATYCTFFLGRDWASGWMPGLVAAAVILLLVRPRATVLLACCLVALAAFNFEAVQHSLWTPDQQYSVSTRTEAADVLTKISKVNPILGLGPANYYHYTRLFPIYGWYVRFSSHSNYIDLIAQFGILGLLCFLWLFASCTKLAFTLAHRVRDDFSLAYIYGCIGGIAGSLFACGLGDWVLPFVYNIGVSGFRTSILAWLFLGGLVAIDIEQRRESVPEPVS